MSKKNDRYLSGFNDAILYLIEVHRQENWTKAQQILGLKEALKNETIKKNLIELSYWTQFFEPRMHRGE